MKIKFIVLFLLLPMLALAQFNPYQHNAYDTQAVAQADIHMTTSLGKITPLQFGAIGDGVTDDSLALIRMAQFWSSNSIQMDVDFVGKRYLYGTNLPMVFSNRTDLYQLDGPQIFNGVIIATNQSCPLVMATCSDHVRIHDFGLYGPNTNNYSGGGSNSVGLFIGQWPSYSLGVLEPSLYHARIQNFGTNVLMAYSVHANFFNNEIFCAGEVNLYVQGDETLIQGNSIGFNNNSGNPIYGISTGPQNGATPASNTVAIYYAIGITATISGNDINDCGQALWAGHMSDLTYRQNNTEILWGPPPSVFCTNVLFLDFENNVMDSFFPAAGLGTKGKIGIWNSTTGTGASTLDGNLINDGTIDNTNYFIGANNFPPTVIHRALTAVLTSAANQPVIIQPQGDSAGGVVFQNLFVGGGSPPNTTLIGMGSQVGGNTYPNIYPFYGNMEFNIPSGQAYTFSINGSTAMNIDQVGDVTALASVGSSGTGKVLIGAVSPWTNTTTVELVLPITAATGFQVFDASGVAENNSLTISGYTQVRVQPGGHIAFSTITTNGLAHVW